jgi:hypothetical protein
MAFQNWALLPWRINQWRRRVEVVKALTLKNLKFCIKILIYLSVLSF